MKYANGKKGPSWRRVALTVLCVVLALILAAMVAATIYIESLLGGINRPSDETLSPSQIDAIRNGEDETDPDATGETVNAEDVTLNTDPAQIINKNENIINILLVGQDRRAGQGRQRSDAMILCTINKEKKTLTMTSFMRDTYVKIPGYYSTKLNAAYMLGGFDVLNETLEQNFGVTADHGIEVDFSGFEDIIDLVGGVSINLTQAEADYLNARGNWDVEGNQGWTLKAGVNNLNGTQALAYSRIRAIGNDFERTNRQRKVLTAVIEKAKGLNLLQLNDLVNGIVPLITTDMENSDITGYVMELFPILADLEIETLRIPADGTYVGQNISKVGSALVPDLEANRQILADALGE